MSREFRIKRPTSDDVRQHREQTGRGMMESKMVLEKQYLIDAVNDAQTVNDLKQILHRIIADSMRER